MFSTAIVTFREILEVSLVLGIILAATKDTQGRWKWILTGLLAGVVGSVLLAVFAEALSNAAEGIGQELFNAAVLLIAAGMIGWTVVWMQKHGRTMAQRTKKLVAGIVEGDAPLYSIAVIIALATLREGSEIVLFTYGMVATGISIVSIGMGLLLGLVAGGMAGACIYFGLIKISPRYIFFVTSWLLVLVASGMASVAAKYLSQAGYFSELSSPLWDSSWLVSEQSVVGQTLHALLGYSSQPIAIQLVFYVITLGVLIMSIQYVNRPRRHAMMMKVATKTSTFLFLALCSAFTLQPSAAHATMKVYSPYVEKGELEVEWRGQYKVDDDDDKDGAQKQKLAIGYGVNDAWFTEIYGEVEKEGEDGSDFEWTALEWENKFQISERGEHFVDVGLLTEYEISLEDVHADELQVKLLLAKDTGPLTHYANIGVEKEVGAHAEGGTEANFSWSTRYRMNPAFEPGIEVFSEFGSLKDTVPFDEQEHYVGPAIYGHVFGNIAYDIGYLFGVSDEADDGVLKWIIEYEKAF